MAADPGTRPAWHGWSDPGKFSEPRNRSTPPYRCCPAAWRYDGEVAEMPIPEGEQLSAVARDAARSGEVVYLTDRGCRLAAIVPAALAELLDRREGTPGRRVLGARAAGRSGRHDISERIEEIFGSEVTPEPSLSTLVRSTPMSMPMTSTTRHVLSCWRPIPGR
jgi:hypothetical protein